MAEVTELRLALVCYGGVSLAVYMHGVTKELHKLVRASRRFDELANLDAPNPFSQNAAPNSDVDTEATYFEALRSLAKAGRRLSVTVDIISGTSAGGINGVVLAKALARDATQQQLKRLWIDEGDLKKLLRAPAIGGVRTRAVLAAVRQVLMLNQPTSPLRGEQLSRLLLAALRDMDDSAAPDATLIPPGGALELYVTATDMHGFEVLVPSGVGGASQRDRYHAQVLEFRARRDDMALFGPEGTAALAFSARATSSFPGAFAPVSLKSFVEETGTAVRGRPDLFRFQYDENGLRAEDAWLVDGGVLDNAPFDLVIDAIRQRPAQTEVLRRVVYIQPDPRTPLAAGETGEDTPAPAKREGWLSGLWRTVIGVRGSHPILLELLKLRDLNMRIAEVGSIAQNQMTDVLAEIRKALDACGIGMEKVDSKEHVQQVSDAMHVRAQTVLGPAWGTYQRLKVEAAGRRLADEIAARFTFPPDSSRATFVRAAISAWARSRPEWNDRDPEKLLPMLGPVDVPYRERRMMFLLAGVNSLYRAPDGSGEASLPPRAEVNALKRQAWAMLEELYATPRRVVAEVPHEAVEFLSPSSLDVHLFDHPEDFAAAHETDIQRLFDLYREALVQALGDGSTSLWKVFEERTKGWSPAPRMELLGRYLGFPLWDGLIFPTIAFSELPQFTPIGISQFSPLTASALPTPAGGKLKGVTLQHFGGFLDAAWRENDYLWGRLDGAELVLRTLHEGHVATQAEPHGEMTHEPARVALLRAGGEQLVQALRAVLAGEQDLQRISSLRADLQRQVDQLAASLPARTV